MSLTTRITLLVTLALAACGLLAGAALYQLARRSLDAEVGGALDARLAWLAAALDVELEDGELQLDARDDVQVTTLATRWQVAAADGRVLWASPGLAPPAAYSRSMPLSFGEPGRPELHPAQIVAGDAARDEPAPGGGRAGWSPVAPSDVPTEVLESARRAVAGFDPTRAYRKTRQKKRRTAEDPAFELHGTAGGRQYAIRLSEAGGVLRVKDHVADPFAQYTLPPDAGRLSLVLTTYASAEEARAELAWFARTLWAVGPLALCLTGAGLALLVRWQLKPLGRMAEQAAAIGPGSGPAAAVDAGGGGRELARLRQAINGMLARLTEGLQRERRFAATAAHELRTPLAQMRATVDVALRRPREAGEYRDALTEVATDIERLQKLVAALLHLTRAPDTVGSHGGPVPLWPLLHGAARQHIASGALPDSPLVEEAQAIWVYGEPELLRAAVGNVLENAARYAPGTAPNLSVEHDEGGGGDTVRVIVSDRGPGISEQDQERVFEPLTRLAPGSAAAEGFGLGLAVARTTLRAFGGDLVCRERRDGLGGAEFVFTLRRAEAPDTEPLG